jgi:hypothetical protein
MDTALIATIILVLVFLPLFFYTRRSSDVRLEGDNLVIRYPLHKKEINLTRELKSWKMQRIKFMWVGKIHAINLELQSGKMHHVDSRSNGATFIEIYEALNENFEEKREEDLI